MKITVGLESHLPCVTDSVFYSPMTSTAVERAMNTSPSPLGDGIFIFSGQVKKIKLLIVMSAISQLCDRFERFSSLFPRP